MAKSKVTIHYAMICDEIRREDNGKLIFIGVYGSSINMPNMPAPLTVWFAVPIEARVVDEIAMEFRVKYNGEEVYKSSGAIRANEIGAGIVSLPNVLIANVEKPGELCLEMREEGSRWKKIRSMPVGLQSK